MKLDKHIKMAMRRDAGYRKKKEKIASQGGAKYAMSYACRECRKSFKRHFNKMPNEYPLSIKCPECENDSINLGRNFKSPKKDDLKQWAKIKFLIEHGFVFQTIYEQREGTAYYKVSYPKTLAR